MNQADRKLHELAAKAARYDVYWHEANQCFMITKDRVERKWRPRDDDGDSFRLAAKLYLITTYDVPHSSWVSSGQRLGPFFRERIPVVDFRKQDEEVLAATRRAIFRAAAYLGEINP